MTGSVDDAQRRSRRKRGLTVMARSTRHIAADVPCVTVMPRLVAIHATDRTQENAT